MRFTIVPSSHLYPLDPNDLLILEDATLDVSKMNHQNEVAVLLGHREKGIPDTLLWGRSQLEAARQRGDREIPVRIYFQVTMGLSAVLELFKYFRKRKKRFSSNRYHINPSFLRDQGLERCRRTFENAYAITRYSHIGGKRQEMYQQLSESLKNGYNDAYPMTIILHRKKRKIDTLDDGHHRLGLCIDHNLQQIAIQFAYTSSMVACLNFLFYRNIFVSR